MSPDGSWQVEGLPPGDDWHAASGGHNVFMPRYDWRHEAWPDVGCGTALGCPSSAGIPITVEAGEETTGIDLLLDKLPRIDIAWARFSRGPERRSPVRGSWCSSTISARS